MILVLLTLLALASTSSAFVRSTGEEGDYFEGDITNISPALFSTRAGLSNERFRWSNNIIPYQFASNYPDDLRQQFRRAIDYISNRTCIHFVPRMNELDYIKIVEGRGCYSTVGKVGGAQDISLPRSCSIGTHVHEVIHAIGFFHEHSRPDRDDYIRIHNENIQPNTRPNFNKLAGRFVSTFGVAYDFDSIMHYNGKAFSRNGRDTITTIPAGQRIGQRLGMSENDILKINIMYKCAE